MIMAGHVVFKADKNYRSKGQFEKFCSENTVSIPALVVLFEEYNDVISNMESVDNMFINRYEDLKDKYNVINMFGYVRGAKRKKNGKPGRTYKVHRKKRFIIPITSLIYIDDDGEFKYCSSSTIHCTFREKLI